MYVGCHRWPPSSAVCWQPNVLGQKIAQPVRWPLFCHCQANAGEQSAWTASATRRHLRTIQTIIENVYVWLVRPWHRVWTLRTLTRNLLTYLLSYLRCEVYLRVSTVTELCCRLWVQRSSQLLKRRWLTAASSTPTCLITESTITSSRSTRLTNISCSSVVCVFVFHLFFVNV